MKHLGCPLIGDPVYANPSRQVLDTGRLMLHAWRLGFSHPSTGEFRTHEAPVPSEFRSFLPDSTLLDQVRNTAAEGLRDTLASQP